MVPCTTIAPVTSPAKRAPTASLPSAVTVPASRTLPLIARASTPTERSPTTVVLPSWVKAPVRVPPSAMPAESLPSTVIVPLLTSLPA